MGTPRLKYNSIHVDLPRRFNAFEASIDVDYSDNRSAYGVTERLLFASQWQIKASRRMLENSDINKLRRFFEGVKDGTSFEFWRDYEFGDYISFDGKSLETINSRLQSTFTRSGTVGTFVDPDTGYVTNIATADTPRYEAGKFGRGVLIEPSSTNLLVRSEEFDNASWVKTTTTVTANVTEVLDPAGGNTADKLDFTVATTSFIIQTSGTNPATTTTPFTFSVWLRSASGNLTVAIGMAQSGSVVGSGATLAVNTNWQRFTVTQAASWNTGLPVQCLIQDGGGAVDIYAWGAQLDQKNFATSYIPTTSATVTRNADRLEYTTSHFFPNTEQRKFSISFWVKPLFVWNDATSKFLFLVDSSIAATYMCLIAINASNNLVFEVRQSDNTNRSTTGSSASAFTTTAFHHVCATCDTTVANALNIYVDGALHSTSSITNPFTPAPATSNIGIGMDTGGGTLAAGIYDDIAVYLRTLTAAEVADIYNKGTGINARRNYWSALRLRNPVFSPQEIFGSDRWNSDLEFEEVLT